MDIANLACSRVTSRLFLQASVTGILSSLQTISRSLQPWRPFLVPQQIQTLALIQTTLAQPQITQPASPGCPIVQPKLKPNHHYATPNPSPLISSAPPVSPAANPSTLKQAKTTQPDSAHCAPGLTNKRAVFIAHKLGSASYKARTATAAPPLAAAARRTCSLRSRQR